METHLNLRLPLTQNKKNVSYVNMKESRLQDLINGCIRADAASQKALFLEYYDFGMAIARRYGDGDQDAEEITNDAFYKMLKNIKSYKRHIPFKLWLRRIVINTGIDHFRKNKKRKESVTFTNHQSERNQGEQKLDQAYLLDLLNRLSPQYKMVFVLYVMEGYSHQEIAKQLSISVGTSKSNLSKARNNLKSMLAKIKMNEKF